ncbi:cellobiohydrolase I-II [Coprinopsis marcescibilis]|uniref:Glucanase n=1 Tax=Coprinopsis marcescibilis TaxID=230819 RepID=A0A5C3L2U1_COPMA|nr:cellobiohydrolase I-II [Coprinopsis marcescibilis]
MIGKIAIASLSLLALARGQQVGREVTETHPRLQFQRCTRSGGCQTASNGQITLDANWRWLHVTDGYSNCYTGNSWNTTVCANGQQCSQRCALEGANYRETYGISTNGNALTIKFLTKSQGTNIGGRVYLMDSDSRYEMFYLLNKEFTFDVDVSKVPCGINGALYFIQMDADGGLSKHSGNKAGAKYGTGYCDSQCPRDMKFINGEANVEGWGGSPTDPNAGAGRYGACCAEMDIWEANKISNAYTPHPCNTPNDGGYHRCTGKECNQPRYEGLCDPDGCDYNPFRQGNREFYGPGKTVDTNKKITVITQFITNDNTATGTLVDIRRLYVQDGRVIQNPPTNFPGVLDPFDSITEKYCTDQKRVFGDNNSFARDGGLAHMGRSLAKGHVLALSIWNDHTAHMLWLDSSYPVDADPNQPGIGRGTCPTTGGSPKDTEQNNADSQVVFSNIKVGDIGTTFSGL